MRIVQVHNSYTHAGGEGTAVEREYADLLAAGHDVTQHAATNDLPAGAKAAALARAPWNRSEARRLTATLERVQPDVVHFHNTFFALSPSVIGAASSAGYPTVQTLHNYRPVCINEFLLPFDIELRQENLATVAAELVVVHTRILAYKPCFGDAVVSSLVKRICRLPTGYVQRYLRQCSGRWSRQPWLILS